MNAQFRWVRNEYIPYYGTEAKEADIAKAWGLVKSGISVWPEDFVKKCLPIRYCFATLSIPYDANNAEQERIRTEKLLVSII